MVSQPQDTPFGLEPNVAAGLAYLFTLVGGIVMLVGGGTNKFVKWAACQSITMFGLYIAVIIAIGILNAILGIVHLWALWSITYLISMLVLLAYAVAWLWTFIMAFQGKEVRVPFVAQITQQIFGSQLA